MDRLNPHGLSEAQWRCLLHLYVGPQYNKRTGKRWYPSHGTYVALQRKGLVMMQVHGESSGWVVTADGAVAARGCIPL